MRYVFPYLIFSPPSPPLSLAALEKGIEGKLTPAYYLVVRQIHLPPLHRRPQHQQAVRRPQRADHGRTLLALRVLRRER